jgi:CHASE3 domain sensor protein
MENRILNEELNNMKYLFGYQRGVVISEQNQDLNEFFGSKKTMEEVIEKLENLINDKTADGKKDLKDEFKMNKNQKEGLREIIKSLKSGKLGNIKPSTIDNNITNSNGKGTAKDVVIALRGKGSGFKI